MKEVQVVNAGRARYEIVRLPSSDPLCTVEALVNQGLAEHFWIYSSNTETRVAIGSIGEVVVGNEQIQSSWQGDVVASEPAVDPFAQAGRLLSEMPLHNWRAFGHVAFDMAGFYFPYPFRSPSAQMRLVIPKTELVVNGEGATLRTLDNPDPIVAAIQKPGSYTRTSPNAPVPDPSDRIAYEHQVAELVKAVQAGQLSKAILARCVRLPDSIDIFSTYEAIQGPNEAARNYSFHQQDLSGVGSSPELLMQTTPDGLILTNPLAGTRPRGITPEEDEALRVELRNDPKEIKEHIISVLLVQQEELKSVCTLGSVCIRDLMKVVSFRTVQHLASSVSGRLAPERTLWDGLRALFPGVTVSGVDKHTAIEKIALFEQKARGPYAGCVGWIDSRGASDLAIAIRSAFEDVNGVSISAGAGIIAESIPAREYEETEHKLRTMQSRLVLRS